VPQKTLEKQVLGAGAKQNKQAIMAGMLTRLSGLHGSQACLLCCVPATSALVF